MRKNTRQMVMVSVYASLASVLYLLEIAIPGTPLKFDLSDLPAMMASYRFGFWPGLGVVLIKNLIHAFIGSNGEIVGEIASMGFSFFLLCFISLSKRYKAPKDTWVLISSWIFVPLLMHVFNYFITMPLFGITNGRHILLLTTYLPFNLIKTILLMTLFIFSKRYFKNHISRE